MSNIKPESRGLKEYVGVALRGMCMGAADIVPGVSGGTLAFILGIYEELVQSIRMVGRPVFLRALFTLRIREAIRLGNLFFLTALATGIVIAALSLSTSLEWLFEHHPVYLWSFFFGLVLASVFAVSRRVERWTPTLGTSLVVGAIAAYLFVGLAPTQTPDAWWFILLSGVLASWALILPGISGAFLLLLLGKYRVLLSAINEQIWSKLFLFATGIGLGLIGFAQVLGWLLHRYHDRVVAVLTGLILGSTRKIWPWKSDPIWLTNEFGVFVLGRNGERVIAAQQNVLPDGSSVREIVFALALATLGFMLVVLLERVGQHSIRRP